MKNEPIVFKFKNPETPNTLYLDRDGVLNEVVIRGKEISSPRNLEEFKLSLGMSALASPNFVKNWNLVIITNQPDISRGLIDLNFVDEMAVVIQDGRWYGEKLGKMVAPRIYNFDIDYDEDL